MTVEQRLTVVCNIFGAIRRRSDDDKQVFPSSFGIGMFHSVVDKDLTSEQIAGMAVVYGKIMSN
jgi:hypothetical protein